MPQPRAFVAPAIRVCGTVLALSLLLSACTPSTSSDTPPDSTATPTATAVAEAPSSSSGSAVPDESPDNRSVAQKLTDASIETRVTQALVESAALDVFSFDPTVRNGHLVLSGHVTTAEQQRRAERVARQVDGVTGFTNRLTVEEQSADNQNSSGSSDTNESAVYHTVRQGDTLWDIAREYRASVRQIRRLNDLGSSSLTPGDRIRVR